MERSTDKIFYRRLRIDGIEKAPGLQETEFVTPYSTRGIMVPKYKLLLQLVSNIPGTIEFDKFLSPLEVCLLHRLLSSTVEPFQRGDERTSCPSTVADSGKNPQAPWITQNKLVNSLWTGMQIIQFLTSKGLNAIKRAAQPSSVPYRVVLWKVEPAGASITAP